MTGTTTKYVLPENLHFQRVSDLGTAFKSILAHEPDDEVITLKNSRNRSQVVSHSMAELLRCFQSPGTFAEAIVRYSNDRGDDPAALAAQVLKPLLELNRRGFLARHAKEGSTNSDALQAGDLFQDLLILRLLQALPDTEVHLAEDALGRPCVLKRCLPEGGERMRGQFQRELDALRHLGKSVSPELLRTGVDEGWPFLVTSYIDGQDCGRYASKYRNYNDRNCLLSMLDLCISITEAYERLHQQGVMHVDIHPGNILVTPKGHVTLIDFGHARFADDESPVARKGISYTTEPEHLQVAAQGGQIPIPDIRSEQYQVAALLYRLISGGHHLDFTLEEADTPERILRGALLPFSHFDLNLPIALDDIFRKALSLLPKDRYSDMAQFAGALLMVRADILAFGRYPSSGKKDTEKRYLDHILHKFGVGSALYREGFLRSPKASINYGASGIAYMFLRMGILHKDSSLLDLAASWSRKSEQSLSDYDHAFFAPEIQIVKDTVGLSSIYHSPSGVHLVKGLIAIARGDQADMSTALNAFALTPDEPGGQIDLATGRASLLTGSALLREGLKDRSEIETRQLDTFGEKTMAAIWSELDGYPGVGEKGAMEYLGIAHGWAGVLYATLHWCRASGQQLPQAFNMRMEQLRTCAREDDKGINWPVSVGSAHHAGGWCKGNAGFLLLWTLLFRHTGDKSHLYLAESTARPILLPRQGTGFNLCCGFAGQAYSLLSLFNLTGNYKYLDAAKDMRTVLLDNIGSPYLYNNSLYKGEPGLATLLTEMVDPTQARMPLFEPLH